MADRDTPAKIAAEFEKQRTTQDYRGKKRGIEGVVVHDLHRHVEEGGELQELVRLGRDGALKGFAGFDVRQINYSVVEPGAIKAFHLHERQDDIWFVTPQSRLIVGLLDCRESSPSKGVSERLSMGGGRSRLLYIPRGVAHGVSNPSRTPGAMVYILNSEFDAADPDEHRLPWDLLGNEFWRIRPG